MFRHMNFSRHIVLPPFAEANCWNNKGFMPTYTKDIGKTLLGCGLLTQQLAKAKQCQVVNLK